MCHNFGYSSSRFCKRRSLIEKYRKIKARELEKEEREKLKRKEEKESKKEKKLASKSLPNHSSIPKDPVIMLNGNGSEIKKVNIELIILYAFIKFDN